MLKTSSRMLPAVSGNLLVVDDAPSILIILKSFLEGDRCRLFPAENGAKALEILAKEQIDLVLLDIMMPEMGGYEVCRQMRADERTRDIPVIFLTGLGRREEIVRGLEVGGSDYLIKPFDREELVLRVRHHLQAYANQRRLQRLAVEQRLLSQALTDELKRQASHWEPIHAQFEASRDANPTEIAQRLNGLHGFFDNVRLWSDLLTGNQVVIRSMVNVRDEITWSTWSADASPWRIGQGDGVEIFADIRMVNLMFGLLAPWMIRLAAEGETINVLLTPVEEAVAMEFSWESTEALLDAAPDTTDLQRDPAGNGDLSAELPLRLAQLIMRLHFGELTLTREDATHARLTLIFPNT